MLDSVLENGFNPTPKSQISGQFFVDQIYSTSNLTGWHESGQLACSCVSCNDSDPKDNLLRTVLVNAGWNKLSFLAIPPKDGLYVIGHISALWGSFQLQIGASEARTEANLVQDCSTNADTFTDVSVSTAENVKDRISRELVVLQVMLLHVWECIDSFYVSEFEF